MNKMKHFAMMIVLACLSACGVDPQSETTESVTPGSSQLQVSPPAASERAAAEQQALSTTTGGDVSASRPAPDPNAANLFCGTRSCIAICCNGRWSNRGRHSDCTATGIAYCRDAWNTCLSYSACG